MRDELRHAKQRAPVPTPTSPRLVAGTARVYDTNTADFHLVANITLVGSGAGFVNDVIVTDTAAYFTDSLLPQLYSVGGNECVVFVFLFRAFN